MWAGSPLDLRWDPLRRDRHDGDARIICAPSSNSGTSVSQWHPSRNRTSTLHWHLAGGTGTSQGAPVLKTAIAGFGFWHNRAQPSGRLRTFHHADCRDHRASSLRQIAPVAENGARLVDGTSPPNEAATARRAPRARGARSGKTTSRAVLERRCFRVPAAIRICARTPR